MKKLGFLSCAILGVLFLTVNSLAQCVQCLPGRANPNVLTCQPASAGGMECAGGGEVCTVSGACPRSGGGGPPPEGGGDNLTLADLCDNKKIGRVDIDDSVIRAIGQEHPRLAIALGYIRKNGFLGSESVVVKVLPIEIDSTVYSVWLERALKTPVFPDDSEDLFTKNSFKLPNPRKGHEVVTYAADVVSSPSSGLKLIRIRAVNQFPGDPSFNTLDLPLLEQNQSKALGLEKAWRIHDWIIR